MKTRIAVEGAEYYAYHGFYDEEQLAGNVFIVDAEVVLITEFMGSDDIDNTINYELIYKICTTEMKNTQRLIETVAFRILQALKTQLNHVDTARVKIQKVQPQLGGKVARTVIEMES